MTASFDYSGKTVLVIGGTTGIGNGIARGFLNAGAQVHIWGTRASTDDYSVEDGDMTGLHFQSVDATNDEQLANLDLPFDRLDVLVCSQGLAVYKREEFKLDVFDKVVDVNLRSLMAAASKFQPMLEESGGSVIFINSVGAFRPTRGNPAYAASKAGALGLTRVLAQAWAGKGIRVNGVAPGLVATRLTRVTTDHPDRLAERLKGIPAGRLGTPEDMAGATLFLASPLASYIHGQTIVVDGGRML